MASFHRHLPPKTDIIPSQAAQRASQPALNNFEHLARDHISSESRRKIGAIESWTIAQAEALAPLFRKRAAGGFIRECHGDLHLANLFMSDGRICPYDSLEFNPGLRWIDQASDISFLVMDLMARRRTDLAYVLLNAWLEATGDYDCLAVLRFYLVYRCMVRLKVASIQVQQLHEKARGEHAIKARHYLNLAVSLLEPLKQPVLLLMHGFSGSGKTWNSDRLITSLPAIRVRSDLERKRLHGLPFHHLAQAIDTGIYSDAATARTYDALLGYCETGLRSGFNMIADATFLDREKRKEFLEMAGRIGARPVIFECEASEKILRQRIRDRQAGGWDESDASLKVLKHQMSHFDPLDEEERQISRGQSQVPE
jgi:predicted kinase